MTDVVVFLLEKLIGTRPIDAVVVRISRVRWPLLVYLIASAFDSCEKPLPDWARETRDPIWSNRLRRLIASEAKRAEEFEEAKSLSLEAARSETFVPFSSEYWLSAAACAFELTEFHEAFDLSSRALQEWESSRLARILEPRLGATANYFKWSSLRYLGLTKEGLPFLHEAAKGQRDREMRCKQWLQLIGEAELIGDEAFMRVGLAGAIKHCPRTDPDLQYWRRELQS